MKIINIMAVSLDGRIAASPLQNDAGRMALGFGCQTDHDLVRDQIRGCDAVITGANSVRAAKKVWDEKGAGGKFPLWLVFSVRGLERDLPFWEQTEIRKVIVSPSPQVQDWQPVNVTNLVYGQQSPATFVYRWLKDQGFQTVLLFGGGYINRLFYAENLVDELKITISPIIIGKKDAPLFVNPDIPNPKQLTLLSSQASENHIFLHYSIRKN